MKRPTTKNEVLAELKVARKFTRAFWPEGLITNALAGVSWSLTADELSPREAENAAHALLTSVAKVKPAKAPQPVRDGLGMELDDDAVYYLQDTRQKVGNCMLFWGPKDGGYTCQLDDAGKYTGAEARDRTRNPEHKAWPCGFIERNAVRHVRADSIDVRLAKIEKVRGPNGDAT